MVEIIESDAENQLESQFLRRTWFTFFGPSLFLSFFLSLPSLYLTPAGPRHSLLHSFTPSLLHSFTFEPTLKKSMSRPSTAASSVDLGALASFPLPPFFDASSASSNVDLRQTSPNWTAYRQSIPSPAPRPRTPDDDFPHAEYFAATTPQRRRGSNENLYSTVIEFDEFDENTPALSSSSYSSRSRTSPFPSPTASSSSSIDSELYHNSPSRKDVGLGLWIVEQERKAAQMEQAMTQFTLSSSSGSSSSAYLDYRDSNEETSLPPFDPFGCASPVQVQRASYIKFESAPAPPVQQRVLRPVPVRPQPQQTSLLPPAVITSQRDISSGFSHPSPFAARPSYVAPGPEPALPTSSVALSQNELHHLASLHNGRVPTNEQMAPAPQVASNGLPPPIVNTGNHGAMIPQQGDWRCGTCTFVVSSFPSLLLSLFPH